MIYWDFLWLVHLLVPRVVQAGAGSWSPARMLLCAGAGWLNWCHSDCWSGHPALDMVFTALLFFLHPEVHGGATLCSHLPPPGNVSGFHFLTSWDVPEVHIYSWGRGSCSWFAEEVSLLRSSSLHAFDPFASLDSLAGSNASKSLRWFCFSVLSPCGILSTQKILYHCSVCHPLVPVLTSCQPIITCKTFRWKTTVKYQSSSC